MKYLLWLVILLMFLPACPRLPEPDGCTPRETRCHNGIPQVCSSTQRWTPADRTCTEIGAVCCVTASVYGGRPINACVPQAECSPEDGGPQ